MGLIKKTYLEQSRKPAFEWVGMAGLDGFLERLDKYDDESQIFEETPHISKFNIPEARSIG